MPIAASAVVQEFLKLGGTQIGQLTQGAFRAGGMCKGVCLDWIRRIMNGKPAVYHDDLYDQDPAKKKKRLAQMNATHELMNQAIRNNMQAINKTFDEAKSLQTTITVKSFLGPFMFWQPDVSELQQQQEQALDQVDHYGDRMQDEGPIPTNWVTFRINWKHDVRSKTGGFKGAQFDNIRVYGGKTATPTGVNAWPTFFADKLTALKPDRCAMLNVFFQAGGHAVAVHRNNTGTLDFYDPNYGIFNFTKQDMLESALEYLFSQVYPSHGYNRVRADWLIFFPKSENPF